MSKLIRILPFMEKEEIKELAIQVINEEVTGVKLMMVYPFLSNSDLDEVVALLIEKNDGKNLTRALPFVSEETLNKIYEGIKNGSVTGVKETFLYPFLGKDQIKSMFDDLVKQAKDNPVTDDDDFESEDLEVELED